MRRIFITGGSRGIGEAMVRLFLENPENNVVFTYRNQEARAHQIADETNAKGRVHAVQMDLLDQESIASGLSKAMGHYEGFDVVIHNAALVDDTPFFFMEANQWNNVVQASLNSFFYINKACLPTMLGQKWGRIIAMVSVSGEMGNRGQVNYSAAKGALISASKALAKEVGRKGVLVNCLSPGLVRTEMTANLPEADLKQIIPLGRFAEPNEIAKAAKFLASDDASYINGTVLQVNGGLYT
ncbi:MAG: SDR family oxidoreductase [Oligoflexales bacterium]